MRGEKPDADNILCNLTAEYDGGVHTLQIEGGEPPSKLRPLIDGLSNIEEGAVGINFERARGLSIAINSLNLPNERADELRKMIESSGFFDLPPVIPAS